MNKFGIVEKRFKYKGRDCICVFSRMGSRCGYVLVDDNKDFSEYDIDCHGGLSFGNECKKIVDQLEALEND